MNYKKLFLLSITGAILSFMSYDLHAAYSSYQEQPINRAVIQKNQADETLSQQNLTLKKKKDKKKKKKKQRKVVSIFEAASRNVKQFKKVLEDDPDLLFARDTEQSPGSSVLHYALGYRNPLVVLYILKKLEPLSFEQKQAIAVRENERGSSPLDAAILGVNGSSPRLVILMALYLRSLGASIEQVEIDKAYNFDQQTQGTHWKLPRKYNNALWEAVSVVSEDPYITQSALVYYLKLFTDLPQDRAQNAIDLILEKYHEDGNNKQMQNDFREILDSVVQQEADYLFENPMY